MKTLESKRSTRHLEQVKSSLTTMVSEQKVQTTNSINTWNPKSVNNRYSSDYAKNYDSYTLVDKL